MSGERRVIQGTVNSERTGRRMASLFRELRGLAESRQVNLDEILAADNIEVLESEEDDPGYTACLLRRGDGKGGGIVLAPNQLIGRKRFSVAHELGHYHIPWHRPVESKCADSDMVAQETFGKKAEWDANDFATELLMPRRLFAADIRKRDIQFATVDWLAGSDMYNVSRTAAAWRVVQTCRDQCAFVVSSSTGINWAARSATFRLPLRLRGEPVHESSIAAALLRGESINAARAIEVPIDSWLAPRYPLSGTLLESSVAFDKFDQILTLLWWQDSDGGDEDQN